MIVLYIHCMLDCPEAGGQGAWCSLIIRTWLRSVVAAASSTEIGLGGPSTQPYCEIWVSGAFCEDLPRTWVLSEYPENIGRQ